MYIVVDIAIFILMLSICLTASFFNILSLESLLTYIMYTGMQKDWLSFAEVHSIIFIYCNELFSSVYCIFAGEVVFSRLSNI